MLLTGALLILAFPAPNLEFLAWFGLVPGLLLIVRSPTAREGGVRAWWLGAGYLIAALYWMAPEIGPAVLLVGAVVGALWVPFGVAAWKLLRPPVTWPRALAALVVVPSCWLLTEWLRSWQALGGPWAVFGASQWQHPAVLALAAVGDQAISSNPGTSPNHARNSRFAAGNARMSRAPNSSISRLGDQIQRPVLLSALRTLPLSAVCADECDSASRRSLAWISDS